MRSKRLLLVDDDGELRCALNEQLTLYEEFDVETQDRAVEALKAVRGASYDLIVMDVGLPDMDGREAVKLLRADGVTTPVIMLTARASDADAIRGLEAGATDYVTKPFKFAVLLARIRAHLRQDATREDVVLTLGRYAFQPLAKTLTDGTGNVIRLTEKESSILKFLYRAGARPVSRDMLLREVWGYNAGVSTHTLETHIYRLRQKIEHDPARAELLVTEPGGYRLVS